MITKKNAKAIEKGVSKSLTGKKTFMGKSTKLGGGGRFAKLKSSIMKSGKSAESAAAIAASIGRKSLGRAKFQKLAAKGRKKA